ncbi:MAG: nickel/cobalt transporter [Thermoleophilaceae bacterium]
MRRLVLIAVAALAGLAVAAPAALAHPLGNFSINHLDRVKVSRDRVDVVYILDQAEIPTFQERGLPSATVLARKRAEVARRLSLVVDGRRVPLVFQPGAQISYPPGQGGLKLTRVVLPISAVVAAGSHSVQLHDETFPGRIGWKAIVAQPGGGTAVRSSAPSDDPTNGLRSYPQDMLKSPLDIRDATLSVKPGSGTLTAPRSPGGHEATTHNRSGDGFAGVFERAAAGKGVLAFFLLAAFAWGAIHALSPGHGKAMVAAYLVGTRGTARHAVALGATVTITHTIGVFTLGVVTLLLSQFILPEQLYPWLNLVSGLMVLVIGAAVLRSRLRPITDHRSPITEDHHHEHGHHHHHHRELSWKGLIAMGASAGLIPCPSALVVLLGAIAQHQIALGLLMIVVFSLGLAATLTGLGLAVVYAGRLTERVNFSSRLATALPAVSALVIVGAGFVLTIQAMPKVV